MHSSSLSMSQPNTIGRVKLQIPARPMDRNISLCIKRATLLEKPIEYQYSTSRITGMRYRNGSAMGFMERKARNRHVRGRIR